VTGPPASSGEPHAPTLETRFVHAFTVRDGKVVAFEEHLDISPLLLDLRAAHART
jgi:hypothetical protein